MQNDTRYIRLSVSHQESHILGNSSLFWCKNKLKLSGELENNTVQTEDNFNLSSAYQMKRLVHQ